MCSIFHYPRQKNIDVVSSNLWLTSEKKTDIPFFCGKKKKEKSRFFYPLCYTQRKQHDTLWVKKAGLPNSKYLHDPNLETCLTTVSLRNLIWEHTRNEWVPCDLFYCLLKNKHVLQYIYHSTKQNFRKTNANMLKLMQTR